MLAPKLMTTSNQFKLSEFISEDDKGYLNWGRSFIRRKQNLKLGSQKDPSIENMQKLDRLIGAEYKLWEAVVRKVLGLYVTNFQNRILKFIDLHGDVAYREIDFIAELGDSLLLCEIKSLSHCDLNLKGKKVYKHGWKQVRKSHSIANNNNSLLPPLLIVIDMSYIFDIDYLRGESRPSYAEVIKIKEHFYDLEKFISLDMGDKEDRISVCWLDSQEIITLAKYNGFLSVDDILRFKKLEAQLRVERTLRYNFDGFSTGRIHSSPFNDLLKTVNDRDFKTTLDK
jgi:hypothetical protein